MQSFVPKYASIDDIALAAESITPIEAMLNGLVIHYEQPYQEAMENYKKKYLSRLMELNANKSKVSRNTGLPYSTLKRWVNKLEIPNYSHIAAKNRKTVQPRKKKKIIEEMVEEINRNFAGEVIVSNLCDKDLEGMARKVYEQPVRWKVADQYFGKHYLLHNLWQNGGNASKTAARIGLSVSCLSKKVTYFTRPASFQNEPLSYI
ncbi:MAG: hypothetical protein ABIF10_08530 [Candidatus Woesearchaeota archaeon]